MKASPVFDKLMEEVQRCFEKLPEHRTGENRQYEIKDAALSALASSLRSRDPFWPISG